MGSELGVPAFLQQLSHTLEVADKVHLSCAFWATLVIAVGPKLVLHTLVWVGKRLSPVQVDIYHLISSQSHLQFVGQVLFYKS